MLYATVEGSLPIAGGAEAAYCVVIEATSDPAGNNSASGREYCDRLLGVCAKHCQQHKGCAYLSAT
jgi:hypothetical protein